LKLPFATAGKPFRKVHLINEKPRGRPKRVAESVRKGERNREGLMDCSSVGILAFSNDLRAYKLKKHYKFNI